MSILTINNISKAYGNIQALNNVSFEVPEGSVFGILGPNGSGKTTLLSIILDVLKSDNGTYLWMGQPGSETMRKQIGSLLETPNFYHYLSATNNLNITQSISKRGNATDIDDVLKTVNLFERKNSRFSTYSLGMKQRLAIAAALLGGPKVLVFDEPTNGLDPVGIAEIRELMLSLNKRGHTIIMASHLLDEVEKVCTHVAILKKGNLVTKGLVDDVLADEDVIEISAANIELLKNILSGFEGIMKTTYENEMLQLHFEKGTANPEALNAFCFNNGIPLKHLMIKKKRLEARFFELTNN